MKIVHIHLLGPYTDGWGYQENVLPEIQVRQGHEVTVITGCRAHRPDNTVTEVEPGQYTINGVKIVRIAQKMVFPNVSMNTVWFHYPVKTWLECLTPDIILVHGLGQGITNLEIRQYAKKHPECVIYGDVHAFEGNASESKRFKRKIAEIFMSGCRKLLYPYYRSVLCITQQCMDYAKTAYKVPAEKLKLFPLGYDPTSIDWKHKEEIRKEFREKNRIGLDELVIVHGGKIIPRRKTEMAVDAVCQLNCKVRLVVFGAIDDSIKEKILNKFSQCEGLIYLGHLSKQEYIKAFLASDIALFPGGQSALWEEAIGCGLPLLVNATERKDAPYYDRGGNVIFTKEDTTQSFIDELNEMISTGKYKQMAFVAATTGRHFFSYERISEIMLGKE